MHPLRHEHLWSTTSLLCEPAPVLAVIAEGLTRSAADRGLALLALRPLTAALAADAD